VKYGLKWNLIAHEMGFPDPVKIKNRYYNSIRRKGRVEEILARMNE